MSAQLAKRSACDRCREHKVRCPRGDQNNEACTRCRRARASCVTSRAKPLGRPRTVLGVSRNTDKSCSQSSPSASSSSEPPRSERFADKSLSQSTSPLPWPVLDDGNGLFPNVYPSANPNDNLDTSYSWLISDAYHLPALIPDADEGTLLESSPSSQESDTIPEVPLIPLDGPPPPAHLVDSFVENSLDRIGDSRNLDMQARNYRLHGISESSNTITLLSRLNGSLARHVADINLYPVESESFQLACYDVSISSAPHPLSPVLQTTSDFLTLIQKLRASSFSSSQYSASWEQMGSVTRPGGATPLMASRSKAPSPVSLLDIPTILMLLAGHLQLIQLYDVLFDRVYISLRNMSYEEIALFESLPGLQGACIPPGQGLLQMKIIFQIIEHYIRQIERFIGLPSEYCVFRQQDSCQGILGSFVSPVLLHAVMNQVNCAQGGPSTGNISSLKGNVQKVQELLQSY